MISCVIGQKKSTGASIAAAVGAAAAGGALATAVGALAVGVTVTGATPTTAAGGAAPPTTIVEPAPPGAGAKIPARSPGGTPIREFRRFPEFTDPS